MSLGAPLLHWLGIALVALVAIHLVWLGMKSGRGLLPWTRLLLPAVVLVETLPLLMNIPVGSLRWARIGTALVLEVALLALLTTRFLRMRPEPGLLPENHLAKPMAAFFPTAVARMFALEFVVLLSALRFIFGGWRHADPPGFSYRKESVLGALLPALPLLILGDLVLMEVFLRSAPFWVRLSIHGLDVYGILWVVGLWSTFRFRPHTLDESFLYLHKGLLGQVDIPRDQIESMGALPDIQDDWKRFKYMRTLLKFHTPGPQQVLLKLKEPVRAQGLFGLGKARTEVLFSVDDPRALRAALGF